MPALLAEMGTTIERSVTVMLILVPAREAAKFGIIVEVAPMLHMQTGSPIRRCRILVALHKTRPSLALSQIKTKTKCPPCYHKSKSNHRLTKQIIILSREIRLADTAQGTVFLLLFKKPREVVRAPG